MNKTYKKLTALIAIAFIALGSLSILAQAQTATVQSRATVAAPGISGSSILVQDDQDHGDDDIIQLNNLTIEGFSGGAVPAVIYASGPSNGSCVQYPDVQARTSKIYPCPLSGHEIIYQISVDPQTVLLLRNRIRAQFSDFAVGDHINVFGFADRQTHYTQALIVRNLDKPVLTPTPQYTQLNNVTVLSMPDSKVPPTSFVVGRTGIEPCYLFESSRGGVPSQCPPPVNPTDALVIGQEPGLPNPVAWQGQYRIQVSSATQILDLYRRPITLGEIQIGDKLNVYGRYIPNTRVLEAIIIRDLSSPRLTPQGNAQLNIYVADNRIVCITTPCGGVNGITVELRSSTNGLLYSQKTVNGYTTFTRLAPGTYTVNTLSYNGSAYYSTASQTVTLGSGETRSLGLFISRQSDDICIYPGSCKVGVASISPISGAPGTTIVIRGQGFTATGNTVHFGDNVFPNMSSSDGSTIFFSAPAGSSPACFYTQPACAQASYRLGSGNYPLSVENINGKSNSISFSLIVQ